MIVYWTLFLSAALGAMQEREQIPRRSLSFGFYALVFVVFIVMAFRETCGDYYTYNLMFYMVKGGDLQYAMSLTDPAYGFLNWLSDKLGWEFYGVNAFCALIFLTGFTAFCAREARPMLMFAVAVAYLIIVVAMGYTRQGTAIGVSLLGLRALMERRLILYIFWIVLAAGFHRSAAILLPLAYFASPYRGIAGRLVAGGAGIIVTAFFALHSQEQADTLVANYVSSSHYQSGGALPRNLMNVAAGAAFMINRRRWATLFSDQDIWLSFSVASVAVLGLTFVSSTAGDRIGLYLIPFQVIVFGRLPLLMNQKMNAVIGVLLLYALSFGVWLHLGNFAGELWLPYKSLLFGVIP